MCWSGNAHAPTLTGEQRNESTADRKVNGGDRPYFVERPCDNPRFMSPLPIALGMPLHDAGAAADHEVGPRLVMSAFQAFFLGMMAAWTPGLIILAFLLRHTPRYAPADASFQPEHEDQTVQEKLPNRA